MEKIKKNKWTMLILGIIFLGAYLLFCPVASVEAVATCTPPKFELIGGVCVPTPDETGLSNRSINAILYLILDWLLGIIGVISMLMFVVSGFQYLTAAGDEKQVEIAKKNIKYSIIGLTVALTSFLIIEIIDALI